MRYTQLILSAGFAVWIAITIVSLNDLNVMTMFVSGLVFGALIRDSFAR